MIEPIAATVAGLDPEIVAKNAHARIAAIASPPGIQPTSDVANRMIRAAMPPSVRNAPARMKNGIAMIAKLSSPVNRRWETMSTVSIVNDEKPARNASTVSPSAIEIGVPVASSASRIVMMMSAVMRAPLRSHRAWRARAARRCARIARAPAGTGSTSAPTRKGCRDRSPSAAIRGRARPAPSRA